MSAVLDLDSLNQLKDFIQDRFPEVVETYLKNSRIYVESIEKGFAEKNAQMVADAAHPLKSSSGNLALNQLSELAMKLEDKANDVLEGKASLEDLADMVEELSPIYEESAALLREQL